MSADHPRISIVTAVRNDAAGLRRTLRSVQQQSFPDREHLVVDGASDDGTAELLQHLDDPRVRWVSEPDEGFADAFNKGVARARGDTLLFLNAGDTLHDRGVLLRVATSPAFARNDLDRIVVYGDAWGIHDDGERPLRCDHTRLDEECSLCHQATFVGRALHLEERYDPRFRVGIDYDLWMRFRRRGVPFVKLEETICDYRFDGLSSQRANQDHIHIENEIIRMLNTPGWWGIRDAIRISNRVKGYRIKKAMETALGQRAYRTLKRLLR